MGIKIHLHCFEYGRGQQPELNKYCEEVHYYQRNKSLAGLIKRLPYIVSSRKNPLLLKNLNQTDAPVLLEGIHCTYYLNTHELKSGNIWVRMHNVEFEYYRQLAKSTRSPFKKIYCLAESRLLKRYESLLSKRAKFLALTDKDRQTYISEFQAKEVELLSTFLPFNEVKSIPGNGNFCLYHGNLSVAENEKAVFWLLKNVFHKTEIDFVIAGKNPSHSLKKRLDKSENVRLVENPGKKEMDDLIKNAHIHLIPAFNSTGIKIKLLNALFNGRFVITNKASVEGTGLETLCTLAETPEDYLKSINQIFNKPFTENELDERSHILGKQYDNEKNAKNLIHLLGLS